tara:strand:- start:605 stop:1255 length:651 start_codon:yes stop_codon:yes gene_type:complete
MAFQSGSQIRPELANADYSGFQNAAVIQAQAGSDFGKSIAAGIEGYQKRKKEKIAGRAKIKRAEALGDSMIAMFADKNPGLANNIADIMSTNFDESISLDQRMAATDGFEQSLMNMFLMNQQSQGLRTIMTASGTELVMRGDDVISRTTPYQMNQADPMSAFYNSLNDNGNVGPDSIGLTPEEEDELRRYTEQKNNTQNIDVYNQLDNLNSQTSNF